MNSLKREKQIYKDYPVKAYRDCPACGRSSILQMKDHARLASDTSFACPKCGHHFEWQERTVRRNYWVGNTHIVSDETTGGFVITK